jgi:hypothetical protein
LLQFEAGVADEVAMAGLSNLSRVGRTRSIVLAASGTWIAAMLVLMVFLAASQSGARHAVAERLAARTSAGAEFAALYVQDIFARERNQAAAWLSGRRPTGQALENASGAIGVPASLLLDRRGRVLRVQERQPPRRRWSIRTLRR